MKSVTENILSEDLSQNRYKILSEKEGWANQDKIRELFTFVDQNLELICDKEQEFSYGDDGSEITVRFYQGVHRKGEAIGWCWEFPLGQILRREIDEVLSLF